MRLFRKELGQKRSWAGNKWQRPGGGRDNNPAFFLKQTIFVTVW